MRSAATPISSKRRAARPNRSPSGPPQCWPKTPHRPCRQRRKLSQTGPAGGHQGLHRLERRVADQRHRLEQHQVGRLVLERADEQLEPLEAVLVGHVAVEAEGHRAVVRAPQLGGGLAREPDAAARKLHPVGRRRPRRAALAVHRLLDAPGVGGDDVAADLRVAAVHARDRARRVEQRPGAPERLVALLVAGDLELPQLGRDAAVEDHALVAGQQLLHPAVRGRALHAHRTRLAHLAPTPSVSYKPNNIDELPGSAPSADLWALCSSWPGLNSSVKYFDVWFAAEAPPR